MAFPADLATVTIKRRLWCGRQRGLQHLDVDGHHRLLGELTSPSPSRTAGSEGATQAEASEATITLDATDCAMMPGDPRSPYYPYVDLGTPVWITVDAGAGTYDLVRGYHLQHHPSVAGEVAVTCAGCG